MNGARQGRNQKCKDSFHDEGLSAAKPQPKQQSLFHHRGTGHEKKFKNDENTKIGLNEIK